VLKKKYNLAKQLILKANYLEKYLTTVLTKSLAENHHLSPFDRLSYFMQDESNFNFYNYFSTYQKLYCLISLSPKVHNKAYHYSRFFLNKQLNKLICSNTLK
jgi:hypothetical protein